VAGPVLDAGLGAGLDPAVGGPRPLLTRWCERRFPAWRPTWPGRGGSGRSPARIRCSGRRTWSARRPGQPAGRSTTA
jgi:hypothetical protein